MSLHNLVDYRHTQPVKRFFEAVKQLCGIHTTLNLKCCKCARMRSHCANTLLVLRSCHYCVFSFEATLYVRIWRFYVAGIRAVFSEDRRNTFPDNASISNLSTVFYSTVCCCLSSRRFVYTVGKHWSQFVGKKRHERVRPKFRHTEKKTRNKWYASLCRYLFLLAPVTSALFLTSSWNEIPMFATKLWLKWRKNSSPWVSLGRWGLSQMRMFW